MMHLALTFAFACAGLALLLCLVQLVRATNVIDRILALDTMVINAIALMMLYGILNGTQVYFEAPMIFAMLGFVSTVAYTRFILRGNIIE